MSVQNMMSSDSLARKIQQVMLLLVVAVVMHDQSTVLGFTPDGTSTKTRNNCRPASISGQPACGPRSNEERGTTPLRSHNPSDFSTTSRTIPFDSQYYIPPEPVAYTYGSKSGSSPNSVVGGGGGGTMATSRVTLRRFLSNRVKEHPEYRDLQNILLAMELSCKTISNLVNRAGLVYSIQNDLEDENNLEVSETAAAADSTTLTTTTTAVTAAAGSSTTSKEYSDGRFYSMKRLDKLSTNVLKNALKFTGTVQMIAPTRAQIHNEQPQQHQPGVLIAYDDNFVACLDPMDGSGNADASICTGTVFGVFARNGTATHTTTSSSSNNETTNSSSGDATTSTTSSTINDESDLLKAVLQPARNMRAAGYCLYSSATVLVFTLGDREVYGFTLDPQIQEFVLTHDKLTIPRRGTVYSCNEANSEGWQQNSGWKQYLRNLKLGQGQTKTRYAHRYVGSMVGDIHRTLLYGGIFAYPSDTMEKPKGNLQLLYKSAPMAFVVHHAGGKALDEDGSNLLDKTPQRIHQKSPCFMGSPEDVDELADYLTNN